MSRREYEVDLIVNGISIKKVVIDPHYEEKHSDSVTDKIILDLVMELNGESFFPEQISTPFAYFVSDKVSNDKRYRLVWLLEDDKLYIGVVNAYRR